MARRAASGRLTGTGRQKRTAAEWVMRLIERRAPARYVAVSAAEIGRGRGVTPRGGGPPFTLSGARQPMGDVNWSVTATSGTTAGRIPSSRSSAPIASAPSGAAM